tara:strand:+ start:1862 stop:4087 length:2226 start_codon:yes stop_codon:yes gene_type:complete
MFPEELAGRMYKPGGEFEQNKPTLTRRAVGLVPGRAGTVLETGVKGLEAVANRVDAYLTQLGRRYPAAFSYLFSDEEEASGRTYMEKQVLTELISRRPDLESKILEQSAGLLGKTNSAEEFAQEISKNLSLGYEAAAVDKAAGVRQLAIDETSDDVASTYPGPHNELSRILISRADAPEDLNQADDDMGPYTDMLHKFIGNYGDAIATGPYEQRAFAQELTARTDLTDEFKQAVLASDGILPETDDAAETVEPPAVSNDVVNQGAGPQAAVPDATLYGDDAEALAELWPAEVAAGTIPDDLTNTVIEGSTTADGSPASIPGKAGDKLLTIANDPKQTPKSRQKLLLEFKKEFMDAMPQYKGASEEEKWLNVMNAGLQIAAGISPNAITNIAEGLKGLGPALAKDAKEKRAWNRQVQLSAAKYGLQNVARDAAELRADAKADRNLYSEVFRVRKGQTFERNGKVLPAGSTVILKVGEITDGTVDLNKLATEDSLAAGLKAYNTRLKLQLDQVQKTVTDPSKFTTTSKAYIKDSMRVRTNIATQSLLSNALAALQSPDALNIQGAYKTALLGIANSFGKKKYAMSVFDGLDTQTKFKDWTNRAVTTQIEGLINEGGKISDQERDLAREIGGAIQKGYFSGIVADKSVLESRIKFFKDSLGRDSDTRLRAMALSERAWDTRYNTTASGRVSYGQMLRDTRKPLSGPSTPKSSRLIPKSLNWKNIISVDPKTKRVLGLKKNFRGT